LPTKFFRHLHWWTTAILKPPHTAVWKASASTQVLFIPPYDDVLR
jgi:hypothetical protein